jgi:hypothetical protein
MYVPLHATAAARAAIALPASRPWQPVELGLVDLPDAARAPQEGQRHRTAHLQHVTGPDLGHARCAAATAAQTGRRDGTIPQTLISRSSRGVSQAARAVDVQLQAWRAMSPIVWNGSARSITRTVTPQLVRSRYVSSDSTLRHASAQQCLHKLPYGAPPLNALVKSASLPICGSQRRGGEWHCRGFSHRSHVSGNTCNRRRDSTVVDKAGLRRHAPGGLGFLPGRTRSPRACMWCSAQ